MAHVLPVDQTSKTTKKTFNYKHFIVTYATTLTAGLERQKKNRLQNPLVGKVSDKPWDIID